MTNFTSMQKIFRCVAFLWIAAALFGAHAFAGVAVIVNPDSGVTGLSAEEAKAIFLGKTLQFPNGSKAVAVDQAEGSAVRSAFADKVLGKSDSQLNAYWSRLIFSGKGSPPKALGDDAAVKAFVANTAGGIGYIDSSKVDSSVKVLLSVE